MEIPSNYPPTSATITGRASSKERVAAMAMAARASALVTGTMIHNTIVPRQ